ncbi:MAG TPA: FmdB family zinc ribbon protein [Thermoanaerobaculia bacterium]|jgi:putative FmdB family regulatory protein|nr:FmdB family zinc ribbon protein [Thermoanaerobaculia bacterium]
MPLLEYRCADCDKTTEELVLAGDAPKKPVCSSCGSRKLSRLLSTFAAGPSASRPGGGFDPQTACGGGACRMPDVCGD